ncbi:DUF3828 domain-containing protein [Capnocytophaga cynodegmi]|uniref:DUF3828 domain-containing protein n=2 Tax=Capnocytophaga cynodegmi TaxID=28189 RepID=UPI003859D89F
MVMKIKYIILLLFFVNCNNKNNKSNERANFSQEIVVDIARKEEPFSDTLSKKNEAEKMLFSFYTEYIHAIDTTSLNFLEVEKKIKQKYLTKKLISKLKNDIEFGELDWDPLIKAQDASSDLLRSLKIKKVDDTHYTILFLDEFINEFITINLTIIKENQSYKIDDVEY